MKIGDQLATGLPTPAAHAASPRKADAWQAQLERAWLDSWQGDRTERQHTAKPGATISPNSSRAASSSRPEPAYLIERCSDERGSLLPEQFNPSPTRGSHEGQSPTAALCVPMVLRIEAPAGSTQGRASGPGQAAEAGLPASAARLAQPLTHGRDDAAAPPAQAEARQGTAPDQTSGPLPARSALQVAVADGAAQVTLRDAALNAREAARIPQAIAHQLLESGLASVRLYVNGRLSQHTRSDPGLPGQATHTDTGSIAAPLHPTPLERK